MRKISQVCGGLCLLACLCMLLSACAFDVSTSWKRVKLKGTQKTVELPLNYDAAVGVVLEVDMRFDDGGDNPVTVLPVPEGGIPTAVVAYPEDLENYGFYAEAEDGVLRIGTSDKYQFDTEAFSVTVYADVGTYRLTGSIELNADAGGTARESLDMHITGGADCEIDHVSVQTVSVLVEGAADISLHGTADSLSGEINGAGDLDCDDLLCRIGRIEINGAGGADVYVTELLDVTINGAGGVSYLGDPTVNKEINGAGAVTKKQ